MTQVNFDFRSDTVTKPTAGMRKATVDAEVGDDIFQDDPTIKKLEATAANDRQGISAVSSLSNTGEFGSVDVELSTGRGIYRLLDAAQLSLGSGKRC